MDEKKWFRVDLYPEFLINVLHGLHYYESSKVFRFFQLLILMKFCVITRTASRPMKKFENIRAKKAIFCCIRRNFSLYCFCCTNIFNSLSFSHWYGLLQSNWSRFSLQECKENFSRRSTYFLIKKNKLFRYEFSLSKQLSFCWCCWSSVSE